MRYTTTTLGIAIAASFAAGIVAGPFARDAIPQAHAQAVPPAPLAPAMIDLMGMKHADIPGTPNPEMNARALVVTSNATIGIQSGTTGELNIADFFKKNGKWVLDSKYAFWG